MEWRKVLHTRYMERVIKHNKNPAAMPRGFYLDDTGFFECCVSAVLCNGAKAFCRNFDDYVFVELSDIDALLVKVWRTLCFSRRVKLRRTCAIAVFPTCLGFLPCDFTFFCHICVFKFRHTTIWLPFCNPFVTFIIMRFAVL